MAIVITAVFEGSATRFGEQAGRYAYLEVGHAAQNALVQAVRLGLGEGAVTERTDMAGGEGEP